MVSLLDRTALLVTDVVSSGRFHSDVLGTGLRYTEADTTAEILPPLVRLPAENVMRFRFYRSMETGGRLRCVDRDGLGAAIAADRGARVDERRRVVPPLFYPDPDRLMASLVADGRRVVEPVEILATPLGTQREAIVRNRDSTLFNFIERPRA